MEKQITRGEREWGVHTYPLVLTKTQMRGMWKLRGACKEALEAASSASRQNVFFTQPQMGGTSLLKSSGQ